MAALTVNVHRGWYCAKGGFEVPLAFAVIAAILALTDPVPPSFDHALGLWIVSLESVRCLKRW